jgi:hypothetical protein
VLAEEEDVYPPSPPASSLRAFDCNTNSSESTLPFRKRSSNIPMFFPKMIFSNEAGQRFPKGEETYEANSGLGIGWDVVVVDGIDCGGGCG